jgi:chromosome segregation ATPase
VSSYDPSVDEYPTTAAELAEFAKAMPDDAHRRLALAIAHVLQLKDVADEARAALTESKLDRAELRKAANTLNTRIDAAQINIKTALDNVDDLQRKVAAHEKRLANKPDPA